jgi:steroid 5-alpha reductase family enzyme
LTFNYWRKGGYSVGSEDYRWAIVRSKVNNTFLFAIFNFTFIAAIQSLLLLLITAPTYAFVIAAYNQGTEVFDLSDLAFSRFAIFLVVIEYFADQQQWNFQTAKHEYQKNARIPEPYKDQYTPEDLERGFVVSGLWSWSRHPNFVAEQAVWLTMYIWAAYRTETYASWLGLGVVGYLLIFQGSTRLTESISAEKYPEYSEYQARVGRFIPRLSVEAKKSKPASKKAAAKIEGAEATEETEAKKSK